MTKKDEKITELGYSVEALEDEVEFLKETLQAQNDAIRDKQARIIELINENDRLTITYEPYIPEDDEDHGLTFYGLKEENDDLAQNVLNKMAVIRELESEIYRLNQVVKTHQAKKEYAGVASFDFWPPSDWVRCKVYKWNPGKSLQAVLGPLRFDWFQS